MSGFKYAQAAWLILAVATAIGSAQGGDTSILCGWAFLVLTFPFWILWHRYVYDFAITVISKDGADLLGSIFSIGVTLLLWWYVVPRIMRIAHNLNTRDGT